MLKQDFESQNFAIFWDVVHNFGKSKDDIKKSVTVSNMYEYVDINKTILKNATI